MTRKGGTPATKVAEIKIVIQVNREERICVVSQDAVVVFMVCCQHCEKRLRKIFKLV
jgi:hypothetical protein